MSPGRPYRSPSMRESIALTGYSLIKKFSKTTSGKQKSGSKGRKQRGTPGERNEKEKEDEASSRTTRPRAVPKEAFVTPAKPEPNTTRSSSDSDNKKKKAPPPPPAGGGGGGGRRRNGEEEEARTDEGAGRVGAGAEAGAAASKSSVESGEVSGNPMRGEQKRRGMHRVSGDVAAGAGGSNGGGGGGGGDDGKKKDVLSRRHSGDSPTSTSDLSSPRTQTRWSANLTHNAAAATTTAEKNRKSPLAPRSANNSSNVLNADSGGVKKRTAAREQSLRRRATPVSSPHERGGGLRNKAVAQARPHGGRRTSSATGIVGGKTDLDLPVIEKSEKDMEFIMRAYGACSLFDELPAGIPRKLALAMREIKVPPNADIIKQGAHGDDSFYAIVEGKVSVLQRPDFRLNAGEDLSVFTKQLHKRSESDLGTAAAANNNSNNGGGGGKNAKGANSSMIFDQQPGHERFIRTLGPGEYFGEVSLLYDTERTATVRSQGTGPCRVFQLKREHYVIAQIAEQETMSRERRKLVSGVSLLSGLEKDMLNRVVDMLEMEVRSAGEIIFEKGEFGDKLYIIESGEVSITTADGDELRRFRTGEYFGEVALINENSTRTANAVVPAECTDGIRLLSLRKDNFESVLGPLKVALHASSLAQIPFFAPLSYDQIADLAQCLQLRKFSAGTTVIKAGAIEDAIYLVEQGSFEEESSAEFNKRTPGKAGNVRPNTPPGEGGVVKRVLRRGDYFGEASLLTQTQETGGHTVRSLGLSSVLSLSNVDIQKKVGSLVQLQEAWRRNAVEAWHKQAVKERAGVEGGTAAEATTTTPAEIDIIIAELEVKCCKAGEVLADAEQNPDGCFVGVVMSGCVSVISKLHRGGEGYSSKKGINLTAERGGDNHDELSGDESPDAKLRSRRAGMERKRLITEGPVDLPHKSEIGSRLFGEEGRNFEKHATKVEVRVVAAAAAVLLVPPENPSQELLRALATLDDHALQNAIKSGFIPSKSVHSGERRISGSASSSNISSTSVLPPGSVNADANDASHTSPRPSRRRGSAGGDVFRSPSRPGHGHGRGHGSGDKVFSRHRQESDGHRDAQVPHRSNHRSAIKIDPRSLSIIKSVGKGGFSRVFHVSCDTRRPGESRERKEFALKVIPIRLLVKNKVEHTVRHERDVMGSINHPSIIRLYSAFKAHDHIYFVMDLVNGLDFYWCMQNFEISEEGAKFYIAQVVLMLEYLHSRTIVYRDIKPENLIIARDGYLRMIDFGLSKFLGPGERSYTFCGTPLYLAPEVWGSGGHNQAVDFWALGVLLYEVTSGNLPWDAKTEVELRAKVVNGTIKFPPGAVHGADFSPKLKQFIGGLLEKNPNKRLGMLKEGIQGVKRAPWLRDIEWKALEHRALPPPFRPELDVNPEMATRVKIDDEDRRLVPPSSRDCPKYGEYFPDF